MAEEIYSRRNFNARAAFDALFHTLALFNHIYCGSAAAVAVAEGAKVVFAYIFLRKSVIAADYMVGAKIGVISRNEIFGGV